MGNFEKKYFSQNQRKILSAYAPHEKVFQFAWAEILTKISEILQIKKPQKKIRYAAILF